MARSSEDEPVEFDNQSLQLLWDEVVGPPGSSGSSSSSAAAAAAASAAADSGAGASAAAAAGAGSTRKRMWALDGAESIPLGVPAGAGSFDVPELDPYKRMRRVQQEDGVWRPPGSGPTDGGRYGPDWLDEQMTREKLLEQNPDYKFIRAVAGFSNAEVERLYSEDSLQRAFSQQLAAEQVRVRVAETQQSAAELEDSIVRMEALQTRDRTILGMISERRRTDAVLLALRVHTEAVRAYATVQRSGVLAVAVGNVLEMGPRRGTSVPAAFASVMDSAIVALFSDATGVDSEADEPDLGFSIGDATTGLSLTPQMVLDIAFWGAGDNDRPSNRFTAIRPALAYAYSLSFGSIPSFVPTFDPAPATSRTAAIALGNAVRRLHVLRQTSGDPDRDGDVLAFLGVYNSGDKGRAAGNLAAKLDGALLDEARLQVEADAAPRWVREARAVLAVLDTAFAMHDAESLLEAPRTVDSDGSGASVRSVAEKAQREAIQRAQLAGSPLAEAQREGQRAAAEVLALPPNHLFTATQESRVAIRQTLVAVEQQVVTAEAQLEAGVPVPAVLGTLDVLGSRALYSDYALRQAAGGGALDTLPVSGGTSSWARAMSWYKTLGGTLFEDQRAWEAENPGGIPVLGDGVSFPSNVDSRGDDAPIWSPIRGPPPLISGQTQGLWDLHVPVLRRALTKIEVAGGRAGASTAPPSTGPSVGRVPRALSAQAAPPTLTQDEIDVFTTMSGGVPPANALRGFRDFGRTRWPLFVFLGRLLETDVLLATRTLESATAQREEVIATTRERVNSIRAGIPQVAPTVMPPYQHRRGWVEQPENSGVVKLKPIVSSAIAAANNDIRVHVPHIFQSLRGDLEMLQHLDETFADFANLVSIHMAQAAFRFPRQYTQLGTRAFNALDHYNVIERFKTNIRIDRVPAAPLLPPRLGPGRPVPAPARPQPRVTVTTVPSNAAVPPGGFVLI